MDWQRHPLFARLDADEHAGLLRIARPLELRPGELLCREGDPGADLFVLVRGACEAVRSDAATGNEVVLSRIAAGDVIGEMALVDGGVRSATVRALEPTSLLALPFARLRVDGAGGELLRGADVKILQALAERLSQRLRSSSEELLKQAVERVNMGLFVVGTIAMLALYILLLAALPRLQGRVGDTAAVSVPLLCAFGLTTLWFVRRSGLPLHVFGLGRRGLGRALLEGALFALPLLGTIVLAKWAWWQLDPQRAGQPLWEARALAVHYGRYAEAGYAALYGAFTFVQELVARCGLQTPLERFLPGRHRALLASAIANLLFALTHLHVSPTLAAAVFLAGLFWGWLYKRHQSLYGCFLNHLLVGTFLFFVLGTGGAW